MIGLETRRMKINEFQRNHKASEDAKLLLLLLLLLLLPLLLPLLLLPMLRSIARCKQNPRMLQLGVTALRHLGPP